MKNPILSICIATFNRGTFIGATLESIVGQATDEVEIVIVDSGSTGHTAQVVQKYQQRFPRLRYVRQEENQGVDRDFNRAVELAQGDFCWLFTDDDLLKVGAIPKALEAIRQGYGLIIVNAEVRGPDLTRVLRSRLHRINSDRVYKPTENELLFTDVAYYLSFIGGVVIRKQLWLAREKEPYFGSLFIHVGVIFQSPLPEDTLVIAEPLVSIRYGNAMWSPRRFEIWMFKWPDLVWSFPHYSDSAKSRVWPRAPWRSIKALLLLRAEGAFSWREYSRLESHLSSWLDRLVAKLIARLPGPPLNLLGVLYYSLMHPSPGMALVDLLNSPFYLGNRLKHHPQPDQ